MVGAFRRKLFKQRRVIPEVAVDHLLQAARRRRRSLWRQALPEEAMIPNLRAVVEQAFVATLLGCVDHFDQRRTLKTLLAKHAVGLVDIRLVMLSPVIIEGFSRHVRLKRVLRVGKVGKRESHRVAPTGLMGWPRQ